MGHEVVLAGRQVGLGLLQAGDARECEHGGHAAAVAEEDVGLQAVAHHQRAARVHAEVLCDALEHVGAGLAHHQGLAARGCLHGGSQAPGACRDTDTWSVRAAAGRHPGLGTGILRSSLAWGLKQAEMSEKAACFPVLVWGLRAEILQPAACIHIPSPLFFGKLLTSLCLSFPISNMEPLHITRPGSVSPAYGSLFYPGSHTSLGKPISLSFLGLTGKGDPSDACLQRGAVGTTGASALEMEKHLTKSSCGYCYKNVFWHRKLAPALLEQQGTEMFAPLTQSASAGRDHKARIQTGDKSYMLEDVRGCSNYNKQNCGTHPSIEQ